LIALEDGVLVAGFADEAGPVAITLASQDVTIVGALARPGTTWLFVRTGWVAEVIAFHVLAEVDFDAVEGRRHPQILAGKISRHNKSP
jgi:hypothetical protein